MPDVLRLERTICNSKGVISFCETTDQPEQLIADFFCLTDATFAINLTTGIVEMLAP